MSKKAKDLEDKIKNAKAVREKELKEAEGEVNKSKKKMEESGRKMKEKYQVNTSFWRFLSAYMWSFFILNYMDNFVCQSTFVSWKWQPLFVYLNYNIQKVFSQEHESF